MEGKWSMVAWGNQSVETEVQYKKDEKGSSEGAVEETGLGREVGRA